MGLWKRSSPKIYGGRIVFEKLEERIVLDGAVNPNPQDDASAQSSDTTNTTNQQAVAPSGGTPPNPAATPDPAAPPPTVPDTLHEVLPTNPAELNVILVSNALQEIESISQAAQSDAKVIQYDAQHDDLTTITQKLSDLVDSTGQQIDTLAVVGHGLEGTLRLGSDRIDISNIGEYAPLFQSLAQNLTEDAQIQFYACSVAGNGPGQALLQCIAIYTGADVFGSVDTTGGAQGDWDLEYASGPAVFFTNLFNPDGLAAVQHELGSGPPVVTTIMAMQIEDDTGIDLSTNIAITEPDGETLTMTLTVNPAEISLLSATGGTWDGGAHTLTLTGDAATIDANLNSLTADLYSNFNGTASIAISVTGDEDGSPVFESITIDVAAVNDAPTLDWESPTATSITEDDTANAGQRIDTFITPSTFHDVDGDTCGIAVYEASETHGHWQYSLDGITWNDLWYAGSNNAVLLNLDDFVRFVPDQQQGSSNSFTYAAWDRTAGSPGDTVSVTGGGDTPFSTDRNTASITVTDVNDAPALDNIGDMTLFPIYCTDTDNMGTPVSNIIGSAGGDRITDVDPAAVEGIALFATTQTYGYWQYSIDGAFTWTNVGAVSSSSALLLRATDYVRFVPDGSHAEIDTISFYAWDQTVGAAGTKVNAETRGGETAFSVDAEDASITVNPPNQAPTDIAMSNSTIGENQPIGTTVGVFSSYDTDGGPTYMYSLVAGAGSTDNASFSIVGNSLRTAAVFDFETKDSYSIRVRTDDGHGGTYEEIFTIAVRPSNEPPTFTFMPPEQTTAMDTAVELSTATGKAINIDDIEAAAGGDQVSVRLTAVNGTLSFDSGHISGLTFTIGDGTNDAVMLFKGQLSAINEAFSQGTGLTYSPNTGFVGLGGVLVYLSDVGVATNGGVQTAMNKVDILVGSPGSVPTNDFNPVINLPSGRVIPAETGWTMGGADAISISDADAETDEVGVTVGTTQGTLTLASTVGLTLVEGDGIADCRIRMRGTVAAINAALDGMVFDPTAGFSGAAGIGVGVSDLGSASEGAMREVGPVYLSLTVVGDVNDPPVVTVPGAQTTGINAPINFTSIVVSDPDVGGNDLQMRITANHGTVSFTLPGALDFGGGPSSGETIRFTGTLAEINTAFANGFTFTPTTDFEGYGGITLVCGDQGYTGIGGIKVDVKYVPITIGSPAGAPENQAPVIGAPLYYYAHDNAAIVFSPGNGNAITVTDPDWQPTDIIGVSLKVYHGTLTIANTTGLYFAEDQTTPNPEDGAADKQLYFSGTVSAVQAALASGIMYIADANYSGGDRVEIAVNDGGSSGPGPLKGDTEWIDFWVFAINEAPVVILQDPTTQNVNEDTNLIFNVGNGNTITISDVDAALGTVQVDLGASNGTLTVFQTTGLSFVFSDWYGTGSGDGTADGSMSFRGTVSAINAALNGMYFAPAANYNGAAVINVHANDLAHSGKNYAMLEDSDVVNITVNAVNDAPVLDNSSDRSLWPINEDDVSSSGTLVWSLINGSFTDADGDSWGIAITAADTANGTWEYSIDTGTTWSSLGSPTGSLALLLHDDALVRFLPVPDYNGIVDPAITYRAWDRTQGINGGAWDITSGGFGGSTAFSTDVEIASITVNAVNDAPVAIDNGPFSTNEDTMVPVSLGGITGPANEQDQTLTFVMWHGATLNGTIYRDEGLTQLLNPGDLVVAAAAGDAAVTVYYLPAADYVGNAELQFYVRDDGGGLNESAPIVTNITVDPVNDAPVAVDMGPYNVNEDTQLTVTLRGQTGPPNEPTQTLTFYIGNLSLLNGSLYRDAGETQLLNMGDTIVAAAAGNQDVTVYYHPAADYNGPASIEWYVMDDGGTLDGGVDTSTTANTTITVDPVNDSPVAVDNGPFSVDEDTTLAVSLGGQTGPANEQGQTLTFVMWHNPALLHGNIYRDVGLTQLLSVGDLVVAGSPGDTSVTVYYLPDVGYTGPAELQFYVRDDGGGLNESPPIVTNVTVNDVNDVPTVTTPISDVTVDEDAANTVFSLYPHFQDSEDTDDLLTYTVVDNTNPSLFADVNISDPTNFTLNYAPDANGTANITIRATDTGGLFVDDTFTVTVNPINDAPVFITGGIIPAINEDIADASNTGVLVADMIADTISDPDGVGYGIAVIDAPSWDGFWQYSLDDGASWVNFGALADNSATMLAADGTTRVRFVPDPNYSGTRSIWYRAWDQTDGHMTGDTGVDVSINGGATAYSSVVQTGDVDILAVNDAPEITVAVGLSTDEDTPLYFAGAGMLDVVDVDAGGADLIQVTLNVTDATLTLDGTTGLSFGFSDSFGIGSGDGTADSYMCFRGTPDDVRTALHGGATGMRLDPTPAFNGSVTFDITVNDLEHTPAPAQTDSESRIITVNAVNDAPVFDTGGATTLTTIGEDDTTNLGNTVAAIIASAGGDRITDSDAGAVEGVAVMNTGSTYGTWEYSLDGGTTWNPVGSVDTTSALLLRDTDRVRFVPAGQGETAMFDFCAWDQTSGSPGDYVDVTTRGGSTAFSLDWKTAGIGVYEVNDAPTAVDQGPFATNEDTVRSVTLGGLTGPTNEQTQILTFHLSDLTSLHGNLYRNVGLTQLIGSGDTVVAGGAGDTTVLIYYMPDLNYTGAAAFQFYVKDDGGTADGGIDTSTPVTTNLTVNAINDAPTDISLSNSTLAENAPVGAAVGNFSTTDVDGGPLYTYSLVAGAGDTDNALFAIDGTTLRTNAVLDYETQSLYSIRIRTDDGNGGTYEEAFTITVTDVNDQPIATDMGPYTVTEDPDPPPDPQLEITLRGETASTGETGQQLSFYIAGTSSLHGTLYLDAGLTQAIAPWTPITAAGLGNQDLLVYYKPDLNYNGAASFQWYVRDDGGTAGGGVDTSAWVTTTIAVNGVNDAPTDISISSSNVAENQPVGTVVGTFSTTDADTGDTHTYSLVAGVGSTDNALFSIVGSTLQTAAVFDFETQSSYSIRVRSDDGNGGIHEEIFAITPPPTTSEGASTPNLNPSTDYGTQSTGPTGTEPGSTVGETPSVTGSSGGTGGATGGTDGTQPVAGEPTLMVQQLAQGTGGETGTSADQALQTAQAQSEASAQEAAQQAAQEAAQQAAQTPPPAGEASPAGAVQTPGEAAAAGQQGAPGAPGGPVAGPAAGGVPTIVAGAPFIPPPLVNPSMMSGATFQATVGAVFTIDIGAPPPPPTFVLDQGSAPGQPRPETPGFAPPSSGTTITMDQAQSAVDNCTQAPAGGPGAEGLFGQ
ncbi:MAG: DUF4347 domain-containing protein [Thermodesulfobacteriota bacterium]